MARVLVLSPHPDDEAVGCGGTLCRHVANRDTVRTVFLTSGEAGGHGIGRAETARIREAEARAAADVLGIDAPEFWRLGDGKLSAGVDNQHRLAALLREYSPDMVYTTHGGEQHRDHRAAVRLLRLVLAGAADRQRPTVRLFEVWTPICRIDHVEDISIYMERKLRAVRAYASQCAVLQFDAAVQGLNRYRGEMHSWPGGDYAEVFTELRA